MKMIAGLGNPGAAYACTRHNCGFLAIDQIAQRLSCEVKKKEQDSLIAITRYGNERLLLAKPQSYMNLSGYPISRLVSYYHIAIEDILIIYDDLSLLPGQLRLRRSGRDGGHNGMKSIIEQLGTIQIPRLKIGIGSAPYDTKDYVLGRFAQEEMALFAQSFCLASDAALCWLQLGMTEAMNRYNGQFSQREKS